MPPGIWVRSVPRQLLPHPQWSSTPLTPPVPASVPEEPEPLEDTLPHVETLQDDDYALPEEETTDPSKPRPQAHSTKNIEMFNAPDDVRQAAQAIIASAIPDDPELYQSEESAQQKRRKVDPSSLGPAASLKWQPQPKKDPDDDAPTSMA